MNELTENINSRSPTDFRTSTPKRNPFDDISKNKEKLTPSLFKIPAPIPKSPEPEGVAAGERAGVGRLKKELSNTDFLPKKALEINNKIIQMEDRARE